MSIPKIQTPDVTGSMKSISKMTNDIRETVSRAAHSAPQLPVPGGGRGATNVAVLRNTAEPVLKPIEQLWTVGTRTTCAGPRGGESNHQGLDLPAIPAGEVGETFEAGMTRMVKGVNSQITFLKDKLTSGTVPKEDMPTLQLQLQELIQYKQQLTEMLTNTMKQAHDTAMAVIRNLG